MKLIRHSRPVKLMTDTEACRDVTAVLDAVEHGETLVITRAGRRIALIRPASDENRAQAELSPPR